MGEFDHKLSAAEHVSRREATALFEKRYLVADSTPAISKIISDIATKFSRGRKLDAGTFAATVAQVRADIVKADPLLMVETSKPASRVLPNSEAYEIKVLHRAPHPEGQLHLNGFLARRVYLTRKKAVIESSWSLLDVNKHLFERAIQRDLVGWHGQLAEVENTVVSSFGLTTLWIHAIRENMIESDRLACPIGNGLMFGQIVATASDGSTQRITAGRDATTTTYLPPSPFLSVADEAGKTVLVRPLWSTAINDDMFRPEQRSLHEGLQDFQSRYATALKEIAESAMWAGSVLKDVREYDACLPAVESLAKELSEIVTAPENVGAIRRASQSSDDNPAWFSKNFINVGTPDLPPAPVDATEEPGFSP